jgi:hypothetical protein
MSGVDACGGLLEFVVCCIEGVGSSLFCYYFPVGSILFFQLILLLFSSWFYFVLLRLLRD